MSSYFLLGGRPALLREMAAAWIALTGGSLMFALVATRFAPAMGQEASYGAALFVAAPTAVMLLQAIRTGRLTLPSLPRMPKGRPFAEYRKTQQSQTPSGFWETMDPDAREGLQWLAAMLTANTLNSHLSVMLSDAPRTRFPIRIDDLTTLELDSERLMQGPDEFTINLGGETKQLVIVKVNKSKREVMFVLQDVIDEGAQASKA